MSNKLAVDVIIRLPEEIEDIAIHYNQELMQLEDKRLDLNSSNCLPHISLAMFVIDESRIPNALAEIEAVARKHIPISLTINKFYQKSSCGLGVVKTPELQLLHEDIIAVMKPYAETPVTKEMFNQDGGEILDGHLAWVDTFFQKASSNNFFPHITLGYANDIPHLEKPLEFAAVSIALCHLGAHCTCRKVLGEVTI